MKGSKIGPQSIGPRWSKPVALGFKTLEPQSLLFNEPQSPGNSAIHFHDIFVMVLLIVGLAQHRKSLISHWFLGSVLMLSCLLLDCAFGFHHD